MPYRYAHYFYLMLIPASAVAFSGYLSDLPDAGISKHLHAVSATLWILLLAGQSASIHNGLKGLHRGLGLASLILFPIYLCGFLLVYRSEARRIIDGDPWAAVFGPGIGAITLIAVAATAYMYYSGLRERRNVQLHARWMLVTVFLFSESVLGRILNTFVPWLYVNQLEDVRRIYDAFHLSQLIAILLALGLFLLNRRHGKPFTFLIAVLIAQSIALELFDDFESWRAFFVNSGSWPLMTFASAGLLAGCLLVFYGWNNGRRQKAGRLA
ncbi:MAG: hypothetical protein QNJ40_03315 [Xanthomonadales bacterium]|nr:hypothetical protein [Xanthomonadales bacterium]